MVNAEIQSAIEAIETNTALYEEINFSNRTEAVDYLEFHVIDRIESLLQSTNSPVELRSLKHYAEDVKHQLQAIDDALFHRLRAEIRLGRCYGATLLKLIDEYVGYSPASGQAIGYDNLDVFTNGLFPVQVLPWETRQREPEMVFYQKTPSRIIVDLILHAQLSHKDVFYDIGSGLGYVAILVHLLSGATVRGIELEPTFCTYAIACASELNLSRVAFIEADARTANYAEGTVFFMYTPCEGRILQTVLNRLRTESRGKQITLFTYGPCTREVARQNWLTWVNGAEWHTDKLAEFRSLPMC